MLSTWHRTFCAPSFGAVGDAMRFVRAVITSETTTNGASRNGSDRLGGSRLHSLAAIG